MVRMSAAQGHVVEEIWRNDQWELIGYAEAMFYEQDTRLLVDHTGIGGNLPAQNL